jgi:hypothetical protein
MAYPLRRESLVVKHIPEGRFSIRVEELTAALV